MQLLFHCMCKRALTRPRKTGEPNHRCAVTIQALSPLTVHRSLIPNGIATLAIHTSPKTKNNDAGMVIALHYSKHKLILAPLCACGAGLHSQAARTPQNIYAFSNSKKTNEIEMIGCRRFVTKFTQFAAAFKYISRSDSFFAPPTSTTTRVEATRIHKNSDVNDSTYNQLHTDGGKQT